MPGFPLLESEGASAFFPAPSARAKDPAPAALRDRTDFNDCLRALERHHRACGALIQGDAEVADMFRYTGLLVQLYKQSKAASGTGDSSAARDELLKTIKELREVSTSLESKLKDRLGDKGAGITSLDLKAMEAAVKTWATPPAPVQPVVPVTLPEKSPPATKTVEAPKDESVPPMPLPMPLPETIPAPKSTAVTLGAVSSLPEFTRARKHLTELRTALGRHCTEKCGASELAAFDKALAELDALADIVPDSAGSSDHLRKVEAAFTRVRSAADETRAVLTAALNPGNTLLAEPSRVKREKTLTFRVPVENGNDVTFDFQGDQMLTLIANSGQFKPIVYRFRQNERRIEGPSSTFTATREFDRNDERYYIYTVTMSFYADPMKAKLTISAPSATGRGRDSVVLARTERDNVRPPVRLNVPAFDSMLVDMARTAMVKAYPAPAGVVPTGKSSSVSPQPAPVRFSFSDGDGKEFDTVDASIASPATLEIYRRAAEAGYEVEATRTSTFQIYKQMRKPDGSTVRLAVGDSIYIERRTEQQVPLGNGRYSTNARAVQFHVVAAELAEHLECPPVLIEKSIRPIDKSTCPELAALLNERPELRVRYGESKKFGSGYIVTCEVLRTDEHGNESVYTTVSLSNLSSEWGSERDSLIYAAIREKDQHGSNLVAFRVGGSAAPDGLPIYEQLCPRTFKLLSLLEQQGKTVTCTGCDDNWITFTVSDTKTGKEICSVNMNTWRFKDPTMRDRNLPGMIEATLKFAERGPQIDPAHAEIAGKLKSQANRPDYVLKVVQGALNVDDISMLQGVERWHALALAKHLSGLPSGMHTYTKAELEEIASPLLHMLARIELKEPEYMKTLAKQSPEALDRFALLLAADIIRERKAVATNVVLDKDTDIISLFHTDKMFGSEALLNVALRVGIPVDTIMAGKNPVVIQGGKTPNTDFLGHVERQSGDADKRTLFYISCHGLPGRIQTDKNSSHDIPVKALAAALLKDQLAEVKAGRRTEIDLSKKTLLINSCYSYNIGAELLYELERQAEGYTLIPPLIMTTANRGMLSWGNEATTATPFTDVLLKTFPHGTKALTVGHLLAADAINSGKFDARLRAGAYITYIPLGLPMLLYTEDHAIFNRTNDLGKTLDRYEEALKKHIPGLKSPARKNKVGPKVPNELSHHQVNPRMNGEALV